MSSTSDVEQYLRHQRMEGVQCGVCRGFIPTRVQLVAHSTEWWLEDARQWKIKHLPTESSSPPELITLPRCIDGLTLSRLLCQKGHIKQRNLSDGFQPL